MALPILGVDRGGVQPSAAIPDRRLTLVTPPTVEPITVEEAKAHLRVTLNNDDARIARFIKAARDVVETNTRRALLTQTWRAEYDRWPMGRGDSGVELPFPPLASVSSVMYYDTADALQTLDQATYYAVHAPAGPIADRGRITVLFSATLPVLSYQTSNRVQITFVCGYGAAASAVPDALATAILFRVQAMYDSDDDKAVRACLDAAARLEGPYSVERY